MAEVEVRAFAAADRTALRAIFGRAGEGAPTASLWGHEESRSPSTACATRGAACTS